MAGLQTLFFLGKGGTGKSTASALLALMLQQRGRRVLLASFDDAHNQADIFGQPFDDSPCRLVSGLEVLQLDREKEIQRYLTRTARQVRQSFTYLTAFNLDHYFDILKFSPGMEEYALVTAFLRLQEHCRDYDYLIIDMPPTALSLRFFSLPALSLTWIEQLEELRTEIHKRKEIISRIKFAGREFERDKVLTRIQGIKADYQALKAIFEDEGRACLFAVFNPDPLSMAETGRICDQLDGLDIRLRGLIGNHRTPAGALPAMPARLAAIPVQAIPYAPDPLIGIPALKRYITAHNLTFAGLLPRETVCLAAIPRAEGY